MGASGVSLSGLELVGGPHTLLVNLGHTFSRICNSILNVQGKLRANSIKLILVSIIHGVEFRIIQPNAFDGHLSL